MKSFYKIILAISAFCVLLGGGKHVHLTQAAIVDEISISFEPGASESGYVLNPNPLGGECGLQTEGGNTYLRLLSETGNLKNVLYTTDTGWGYNSITAEFDIRFKAETGNYSADGCSFVLMNPAYSDVSTAKPTEDSIYSQTLGFGMDVYNNGGTDNPTPDMTFWWNNQAGSYLQYEYRTGDFLKAKITVDYHLADCTADLTWTFSDTSGNELAKSTQTITNILPYLNNPMFGGRTGGVATEVDIDNLHITYENTLDDNEYVWKAGTTGTFQTASNWVNEKAPTGTANVYFLGKDNVVTGSDLPTISQMNLFFSGTTTLNQTDGKVWTFNSGSMNIISGTTTVNLPRTETSPDPSMIIGGTNEQSASLNIADGTLAVNGATFIGTNNGNGTLTMTGGALNLQGKVSIAFYGSNTTGSATLSGGKMTISNGSGSNIFVIGDNGTGSLLLQGTGQVENNNALILGYASSGKGTITIASENASFVNNTTAVIGRMGTGTINLSAGLFQTTGEVRLGTHANSHGILNISGGTFTAQDSAIYAGCELGAIGEIHLSGSGTLLQCGSLRIGYGGAEETVPDKNGSGKLTVGDDARLNVRRDLMISHSQSNAISEAEFSGNSLTTASGHMIFGRRSKATVTQKENAIVRFLGGSGLVFGLAELGSSNSGTIYNMEGGLLTDEAEDGSTRAYYNNSHMIIGNEGSGTFHQTGGTVQIQNLDIKNAASVYNLAGGNLNVSGQIIRINDNAEFNFTGGTLSAGRVGFELVQEGTGNLSPGIGDGTIGTTDIDGNYFLKGGQITLDILPDMWDSILVGGNVDFGNPIELILNFDEENILAYTEPIPFLTADGTISNWSNLWMDSATDYLWNIYQDGGGLFLAVDRAAVPEPSTWLLLFGLMLGMGFWQRTQKNKDN